ncbi:energy transducer TonB [Pseudomonas sp. S75]|uniref:energy transducer TonB n=1 Tax=unclassified Pseudomonas TaxID=196821 RepID=UPI001906EB4E|nr:MULTISPECIES: energy transducer TonB [unclassified Pseudomonas]MBJ9977639.1 energy transducer TonB [Pseudomonas sp. S30]MBK0155011.1 energy transducer TonB [Pseudomonas sp. S75]
MANTQTASALDVLWRPAPGGVLLDLGRVYRGPLALSRLHSTPGRVLRRREAVMLGIFALALHGAVIYWISRSSTPPLPVVPPQVPPMTIEFSQPAPPVVEPPPPEPVVQPAVEPPPPVEDELASKPPPPKPVVKPKPKPVPKPVPKPAPKPAPAPTPVQPPPQAATPPAPPAPPAPAPITPASANAGYLRNPAPEYPALALRRNWQGTVLLRVHVLASGKPGEVQIQQSSGRSQLDDAALAAVKRWSFAPAKQGDTPIDGWVSVPIDFKLQ